VINSTFHIGRYDALSANAIVGFDTSSKPTLSN